jgi:hypothetical protein
MSRVQVVAAHHREAVGVVEAGAAGERDGLRDGVDEVVDFLARAGAGPMPRMPFSLCRKTSRSFIGWLATCVSRRMPRST